MGDNSKALALIGHLRSLAGPLPFNFYPVEPIVYEVPERERPGGYRDHGAADHRAQPQAPAPSSLW